MKDRKIRYVNQCRFCKYARYCRRYCLALLVFVFPWQQRQRDASPGLSPLSTHAPNPEPSKPQWQERDKERRSHARKDTRRMGAKESEGD
ncbi:hypothetical protein LZ32DRAFT_606433, partial [Colletotrichum eremochloae]